jgi:adenine-specific DNA-methyltransferase
VQYHYSQLNPKFDEGRKYAIIMASSMGELLYVEGSEKRLSETTGGKKSRSGPRRSWIPWVLCIVYVNEQSVLTPKFGKHNVQIPYVEPEFKRLTEV